MLDVQVDGGSAHSAILKEFQRDKVRGTIIHIDLQEVRLDQAIQTSVQVTLVGEPIGVREGGILTHVTTEVAIEALPLEVPQHLEADVSDLGVGDALRLSQVEVPEGVKLLDDPEEVVIASVSSRAEKARGRGGRRGRRLEQPGPAEPAAEEDAATPTPR